MSTGFHVLRGVLGGIVLAGGVLLLGACSQSPQTDSKSNWYSLCASDAECGESLSCACGFCTKTCASSDSCDTAVNSSCLDPNTVSACSTPSAQVCVESCEQGEECGAGKICLGNICIREGDVEAMFCDDYEVWPSVDRDFELLAMGKINAMRRSGGECQGETLPPVGFSLLDFRLRCAARHQSRAMFEQDVLLGTTPDNVSFSDRMNESGYDSRAAKVIVSADSSETYLDSLLVEYCADILDPTVEDFGVGKYQDRLSILLARE